MNLVETKWRKDLTQFMEGLWLLTRHEDGLVGPGVPDLSFVMKSGSYETGWLELKAVDTDTTIRFYVEPSQHAWMAQHCELVPCYFLVATPNYWWLIHGRHHEILDGPLTDVHLTRLSTVYGPRNKSLRPTLAHTLKDITIRR